MTTFHTRFPAGIATTARGIIDRATGHQLYCQGGDVVFGDTGNARTVSCHQPATVIATKYATPLCSRHAARIRPELARQPAAGMSEARHVLIPPGKVPWPSSPTAASISRHGVSSDGETSAVNARLTFDEFLLSMQPRRLRVQLAGQPTTACGITAAGHHDGQNYVDLRAPAGSALAEAVSRAYEQNQPVTIEVLLVEPDTPTEPLE